MVDSRVWRGFAKRCASRVGSLANAPDAARTRNTPRMLLRADTIVAPSGFCGVHSLPKAGQSCGFLSPRRTCPLMHRRFLRLDVVHLEQSARRRGRDIHGAACSRSWESGRRRAICGRRLRKLRRSACCDCGLPSGRTARAYWFSTSARPASSCRTVRRDAFEQIERLEAGNDDRHADSAARSAHIRGSPSRCRHGPVRGKPCTRLPGLARLP